MQVYQTDHEGFYVGTNSADSDPLLVGNWLIPGGCVTAEPPALTEGQRAQWTGSAWTVVNPVPEPEPEPEPEPAPTADQVRAERDSKLAATDWMALSDVTMSPEWAAYRQALRDVPDQVGFPENVTWPVKPE